MTSAEPVMSRSLRSSPLARANAAAEAMAKAQAIHDRRPNDEGAYRSLLEARVAWLEAEIAVRDRTIGTERRRSAEIGKRLRAAKALLASVRRPVRRRRADVGAVPQLNLEMERV
jgi:hypothetical protein